MTDTRSDLALEMQLADEFQSISQVGPSAAVQHAHLDLLHAEQRALSAQTAPSTASRALGGVTIAAAAAAAAIVFGLGTLGGHESITATSSNLTSEPTVESTIQLDDPETGNNLEATGALETTTQPETVADPEIGNNVEATGDAEPAGDDPMSTTPGFEASAQTTPPSLPTITTSNGGPAIVPSTTSPGQYGTIEPPTTTHDVAATTSTTPTEPQPNPTVPNAPTTTENVTDTTAEAEPESSPTSAPTSPTSSTTLPSPEPVTSLGEEPMDLEGLECNGLQVTIAGSHGTDIIVGTPGDDVIAAGNGDDTIYGLDGNDLICGGNGDDTIYSGPGTDTILGGNGIDTLEGNAEDSWLQQRGDGPAAENLPNP